MPRSKNQDGNRKKADDSNVMGLRSEVLEQPITETLEVNYVPYAMSVILSRAIPGIDGFKPSQRKLLYTMYRMKLLGGPRTKSANIVGQTMRLNPHGDAAIYETMVRLSRDYGALLHPLVDSKGNFGKVYSKDMTWAASRYTEARLDPICGEVFGDIDQDAVDFTDNYDGSMKEPMLLPTAFPNVLVSANLGVAVGMASKLCGFNLGEVCDAETAYLKDPDCDLLSILKAPDFPTGGQLLYDRDELARICETGRGSLKVRGRWRYDKKSNLIEIYEIPYTTTTEAIIDKVADLVKAGRIRGISDMRDETDLSGLKLTIDLKRGTDPEKLMEKLFRTTSLQDSFACNFNILISGTPQVLGVRQILKEWTDWRMDCVRRRTRFTLKKQEEKLHLLLGLKEILLDIDKAIQIIRDTEKEGEVVPNLMTGFGIDQIQAEYVADIRLRNINKEYILKRVEETSDLEEEIADLSDIVDHPERIKKIIAGELAQVKKKYAVPRRTEIIYDAGPAIQEKEEDIPDYPVIVLLSREGYLKKIAAQSLRKSSEQKYKEGDGPAVQWKTGNAADLLVFTDRQQCYKARLCDFEDIKAGALGDYLPTKLKFDEGEVPVWACPVTDYKGSILFIFENGKAARVKLASYQTKTRRRRLKGAYSGKSPLVSAVLLKENENMDVAVASTDGRVIIFNTSALNPKPTCRNQGSQVISLKPRCQVEWARPLAETQIQNISRYHAKKTLPAVGALLKPEDGGKVKTNGPK